MQKYLLTVMLNLFFKKALMIISSHYY